MNFREAESRAKFRAGSIDGSRSHLLRSLLLVGPDKQRILLDGQMRRVQRMGVRLSVTPMVIRVALSATAGESEK